MSWPQLISSGSIGLVAVGMMVWLFKTYLPQRDREQAEQIKQRDGEHARQIDQNAARQNEQRHDFLQSIKGLSDNFSAMLERREAVAHSRELERDRIFQQELAANREQGMALARSVNKLTLTVLYHDATSKGVAPETLGKPEDILRLLEQHLKA